MDWAEHAARMGNKIRAYRVLVRRPDGKGTRRRCRHIREDNIKVYLQDNIKMYLQDNIKMYLQEVGWWNTDCNCLAAKRGR